MLKILFLFFFAVPALAQADLCQFSLAQEVQIDDEVERVLGLFDLTVSDLVKMIRTNLVTVLPIPHESGVVAELFARSPSDHLIYGIAVLYNAEFGIFRVVNFQRAGEPMASRFDFLKMEAVERNQLRQQFDSEIAAVQREMGGVPVAPKPKVAANTNFTDSFQIRDPGSVFFGWTVGFEYKLDQAYVQMAKRALQNSPSFGRPWDGGVAYDLGAPFQLNDSRPKVYVISPTEYGYIFVLLRKEEDHFACERIGEVGPADHHDFVCKTLN